MGSRHRLSEIGERLGGREADFAILRLERLTKRGDRLFADRLQSQGGGRRRDRIGQLTFEELQSGVPSARRLDHRDVLDHADVAAEIVTINGGHLECDVAVRLGIRDAPLDPLDHGVKAAVDPVAQPLRHCKGAMVGGEDESHVTIPKGDAPTQHAGADLRLGVERATRHGVDEQRPRADTEFVSVADRVADDRHLRQPRLHQPAAGEAHGVVVGWHFHVDIEAVALADASRQVAVHPAQ